MVKKLCTIFMLALMSAPLLAQTINGKRDGVMFAPRKGQWQFSMFLGGGNTLYNESIASFTTGDLYDHRDAEGFINLFGLSTKVRAMKMQEVEGK